jgi:hypothetical protein
MIYSLAERGGSREDISKGKIRVLEVDSQQ